MGAGASAARLRFPRLRPGVVLIAACAAVTLVVAGLIAYKAPLRFQLAQTGAPGVVGRAVLADARSDLPLQFSDGSTVTFLAGSAGRMQRLAGSGAEMMVEHGRLDAHVVHAESTLWLVHAGPFQVRVTGTRFSVGWSAPNLDVAVYEGSVIVEGSPLGAGVPLHAGHRLTVRNGVVRTESLLDPMVPRVASDAEESRAGPSPTPPASLHGVQAAPSGAPVAPDPSSLVGSRDGSWLSLAHRGAYVEAHIVAKRLGWKALCRRLDARRLLLLGDVARYAGARADAHRAFESLVRRFPGDRLAADAVFSLGRLAFEAGQPTQAARWFRRYSVDWPNGPLVDQAIGRQVECAVRMDDRVAARNAAQAYLARAPNGPHAPLAHDVLGQSPDGSP